MHMIHFTNLYPEQNDSEIDQDSHVKHIFLFGFDICTLLKAMGVRYVLLVRV